jgi:cytochrome P450
MVYSLDLGLSAFGTTDHRVHRLRRGAINPFFSKRKVNELQHLIQQHIKKLCDKLEKYRNTGVPIDFESAFGDFTLV